MPRYNTVGISASLSIADVEASLSQVDSINQGPALKKDAGRVMDALMSGKPLSEQPVASEWEPYGGMRFIGLHEDMPFFIAQAAETLHVRNADVLVSSNKTHNPLPGATARAPLHPRIDASLSQSHPAAVSRVSSLSTDLASRPQQPKDTTVAATQALRSIVSAPWPPSRHTRNISHFHTEPKPPRALMLTVEIQERNGSLLWPQTVQGVVPHLKVEVFLNGDLVDVASVNKSRNAVQLDAGKLRFKGTRVHRQAEMPWLYQTLDHEDTTNLHSRGRWEAVASQLKQESKARGVDKWAQLAPSAAFLAALAEFPMPEVLGDQTNFGIIDLVVTTGHGFKYSMDNGYLSRPTRLDSTTHSFGRQAIHPQPLGAEQIEALSLNKIKMPSTKSSTEIPLKATQPRLSSSEIPLPVQMRRKRSFSNMPSESFASNKDQAMFERSVDLADPATKADSESIQRPSIRGRTFMQVASNIRRMGSPKRKQTLLDLEKELGEGIVQDLARTIASPSKPRQAGGKNKTDPALHWQDYMNAGLTLNTATDTEGTTEPVEVELKVNNRKDLLTIKEVDSDGTRTERRSARIAQRTPSPTPTTKIVSHDAAAVNPEIVSQKLGFTDTGKSDANKMGSLVVTPAQHRRNLASSSAQTGRQADSEWLVESDDHLCLGSSRRVGRQAGDAVVREAIAATQVPLLSQDSVVTYARSDVWRAVGKQRPGEFNEHQLVVGMRFIVT